MKKTFIKTLFFLLALGTVQAFAEDKKQAPQPPAQPKTTVPGDEVNFSYGTVVRVTANQITVSEYDYENDTELNLTYEVDPAAKFKNVDSLKHITAGKTVEINFIVKNNKKIAVMLSIEEEFNDEMDSTIENYDEDVPLNEEE